MLIQVLSGDFQHESGKLHAKIRLSVQWFVMCIFLFLRFNNFIKGIVRTYIAFLKS